MAKMISKRPIRRKTSNLSSHSTKLSSEKNAGIKKLRLRAIESEARYKTASLRADEKALQEIKEKGLNPDKSEAAELEKATIMEKWKDNYQVYELRNQYYRDVDAFNEEAIEDTIKRAPPSQKKDLMYLKEQMKNPSKRILNRERLYRINARFEGYQ